MSRLSTIQILPHPGGRGGLIFMAPQSPLTSRNERRLISATSATSPPTVSATRGVSIEPGRNIESPQPQSQQHLRPRELKRRLQAEAVEQTTQLLLAETAKLQSFKETCVLPASANSTAQHTCGRSDNTLQLDHGTCHACIALARLDFQDEAGKLAVDHMPPLLKTRVQQLCNDIRAVERFPRKRAIQVSATERAWGMSTPRTTPRSQSQQGHRPGSRLA
eukprot:TRINITY_DN22232_c0_g1_i2.p1 TRINITY_DN22232_c0_g1~~TRINITY_DN22232_c0_g1_i2.p1  ORF type:complete len:220 (-),score=31.41 TRINITY_DN22232_c0_g1_i2:88-747(-)